MNMRPHTHQLLRDIVEHRVKLITITLFKWSQPTTDSALVHIDAAAIAARAISHVPVAMNAQPALSASLFTLLSPAFVAAFAFAVRPHLLGVLRGRQGQDFSAAAIPTKGERGRRHQCVVSSIRPKMDRSTRPSARTLLSGAAFLKRASTIALSG